MSGKILTSITAGVLLGTTAYFLLPATLFLVVLLLALAAGGVGYIFLSTDVSAGFVLFVILLLAVAAGLLRANDRVAGQQPDSLADFSSTTTTAVGEVVGAVERGGSQTFPLEITEVAGGKLDASATAIIYAGSFPEVWYGDRLEVTGQLEQPENFQTDTGQLFNYKKYLAKDDVFYVSLRPQMTVLQRRQGSFIRQNLADLRRLFSDQLSRFIPAPVSGFSRGVVLGEQGGLSEDLLDDFRRTGVVHVVVLSGFHVTIVALIFFFLLRRARLSVPVASIGGILAIVLFALMVGPTATVVRASIMASIALFGRGLGRSTDAGRALTLAVLVMVFFNPYILLYDPGFQLSVLATAGLVYFGDEVSAWLGFVPRAFGLRETVTATVCAQVAVLPMLLFVTGNISVVSLLANVLVLPIVPPFMALSALVMLFGFTGPLSSALGVLAYGLGSYMLAVVTFLADLPLASITVGSVPVWLVAVIYAIMALGWLVYTRRWRPI